MYNPPIKGKAIRKSAKVISPYSNPLQDIGHISALVDELRALRQDIIETTDRELDKIDEKIQLLDSKMEEVDSVVKSIKKLEKGEKGEDADEEKIAKAVKHNLQNWVYEQVIPEIRQPIDGVSPDPKDVANIVLKSIPKIDEQRIINKIAKQIKPSLKIIQDRTVIDEDALIEKFLDSPKFKDKITGIDNMIKVLDRRYIHGGGDTVSAGTNVTITNVNGTKQINATSGGFSTLTLISGDIDDTNTVFVFSDVPSGVIINGSMYLAGQTSGGVVMWTNIGATVTLANPVGTGGSIGAFA